ncbi:PA2169 family four-helix-bundle protein [Caldibacillus lycopersici]|uniref:PA2169 family four-helix-bundle protein n=1 Tax=Perspicuibacillus lycopersici TaxID=1325689 RepID=A0AAE3IR91_9BACI|nr:PA2169 family four-helix-bundle protein [Perspicuibacillus lycopersici]MCU9613118.1 PA2169 family four-helix-bundle protein [Perspicuibacillus lycopersici]
MENEIVMEELNTLLRGTYMGIRSLEHYIQKVNNPDLKRNFQQMQQEQKQNAQKIAETIQNLGGIPADDEGFSGSMHSFMHKFMISDNDDRAIIEDALKGFDKYGVDYSEELVKGDLDPGSKQIVEEVINDSRRHAEQLRNLLH